MLGGLRAQPYPRERLLTYIAELRLKTHARQHVSLSRHKERRPACTAHAHRATESGQRVVWRPAEALLRFEAVAQPKERLELRASSILCRKTSVSPFERGTRMKSSTGSQSSDLASSRVAVRSWKLLRIRITLARTRTPSCLSMIIVCIARANEPDTPGDGFVDAGRGPIEAERDDGGVHVREIVEVLVGERGAVGQHCQRHPQIAYVPCDS